MAWADHRPWWRRLVLVRVLGERGELDATTLERALGDARWPVRMAALRVAGLPQDAMAAKSATKQVARLLDDEFVSVRRECLKSLARQHKIDDRLFLRLLSRKGFAPDLIAIYLARPDQFGPEVLARLLSREDHAARVLAQLPGRRLGPARRVLLDYVQSRTKAGLRCLALTALPRRLWPGPVLPIVRAALREQPIRTEALLALSAQLVAAEKIRLLEDVVADSNEDRFRLRLRMSKGLVLSDSLRSNLMTGLDACPADRIGVLVQWFEESRDAEIHRSWKQHLLARLESSHTVELSHALMAPLSRYADPKHPAIARRFLLQMKGDQALAEIAFRSLKDARYLRARVAYVRRTPDRLQEHARRLLLQADQVEAGFWLELLRAEASKLRWIAAQGLKGRSDVPRIRASLDAAYAIEKDEGVLSGLLQSLLHGATADQALVLARSVVDRKLDSLDGTLITILETARRPRLDAVLDELDSGRLARSSLLVRAFRWQVPAIRKVLLQPGLYSERELRKLRKRLARVLGKADLPLLARYLLGEGGPAALPFVRSEIVEWLRLRRDLQADALIERAWHAEKRMEIKEGLCAALVERGRLDILKPLVDKWMLHEDEESFGLLFEVLGALRGKVERQQCRFLMRLFLAPMIRDPLAAIRKEQNQQTLRLRIGVLYPMLQPVVERLILAGPKLIQEALVDELRDPGLREAFAAMSKSYLLRALYVAGGYEGGIEAMRPLLELAPHMVPRPHESDGAFDLLRSGFLAGEGDLAQALVAYRRGLLELALADWSPRLLEFLVSSLYRGEEGFGSALLRAHLALLEARLHLSLHQVQKSREAAERARLAIAPHGFGPAARRFLQKLASQTGRSGR